MNLFLIGMMASGKTTVGRLSARKLKWKLYDSDSLIVKSEKMAVSGIFARKGEDYFRSVERKIIGKLSKKNRAVISTGGGAPCFEENWRSFRKNGIAVWLKASAVEIYKRLKKEPPDLRPLMKHSTLTVSKVSKFLKKRDPFYRKADYIVDTDGRAPKKIAEEIFKIVQKRAGR